jgi:hypothetical protein
MLSPPSESPLRLLWTARPTCDRRHELLVFTLGVLAFIPLDLGTTALGLHLGAIEANPYAASQFALGLRGWLVLLLEKTLVVGLVGGLWASGTVLALFDHDTGAWCHRAVLLWRLLPVVVLTAISTWVVVTNVGVILSLV